MIYSMDDRIDHYQTGFTSQFEYLQQKIDCIEDLMEQMINHIEDLMERRINRIENRMERQHEKMMTYLCSVFPFTQP